MTILRTTTVIGYMFFISACATTSIDNNVKPLGSIATETTEEETTVNEKDGVVAGIYYGEEVLRGGTFPLRIAVDNSGRIRITDVDEITARGKLNGTKFLVKRPHPRQVFEGEIVGNVISGITYGNPYLGDGTFRVTLQSD